MTRLQIDVLAQYNAEVYRGIMHTEEWKRKMRALKLEYDKWIKVEYHKDHAPSPRTQSQ